MSKAGSRVCFHVAKRAAFYNGLSTWMQSTDDSSPTEEPANLILKAPRPVSPIKPQATLT